MHQTDRILVYAILESKPILQIANTIILQHSMKTNEIKSMGNNKNHAGFPHFSHIVSFKLFPIDVCGMAASWFLFKCSSSFDNRANDELQNLQMCVLSGFWRLADASCKRK